MGPIDEEHHVGPPADPRQAVHEALSIWLPAHSVARGDLPDNEHAVLVRWVAIGEVMLANDRAALIHLSGTASGSDVRSWDQLGMLSKIAFREAGLGGGH